MAILRRTRKTKKVKKLTPVRTIKIQGAEVEGASDPVLLESLLTGHRVGDSVPGTSNAYKTYESQVRETYRKYNAWSDFGGPQVRAVVDIRSAFISGEGFSVSAENDQTAKWIENFLDKNNYNGDSFLRAVQGTELAGQSILILKAEEEEDTGDVCVKIRRIPYALERPYRAIYTDPFIKDELEGVQFKLDGIWTKATLGNFVYIRTGGDDYDSRGPTTRVGIVLTDVENYDRALRDMRRNNHIMARITPVWETTSGQETKSIKAWVNQQKWRIGQAFIGTAKFKYETPKTGAHENLQTELVVEIKTISSVSGVPVHWLGYTDLMSNRSTADSLYEMIKHATVSERTAWSRAMYELIIKAQEMYINAGGTELPALDKKIQVTLPLIDFSQFKERVQALSMAYADEAISIDTYRGQLPGVDPLKEDKAVESERKEREERFVKSGFPVIPKDDDEGEEEDGENEDED